MRHGSRHKRQIHISSDVFTLSFFPLESLVFVGWDARKKETKLFIEDVRRGKRVVQTVAMGSVCVCACVRVCVFNNKKPVD